MTDVFINRGNLDADMYRGKRISRRREKMASTSQGLEQILFSWFSEETNPDDTLISDFQSPKL